MSKINDAIKSVFNNGYNVINGKVFSKKGLLKLGKDGKGYSTFGARFNGVVYGRIPVHKLVAYQKYGDKLFEDGIQVRHLDGNPENNSAQNIAIGTASENQMDIPIEVRRDRALKANASPKRKRKFSEEELKNVLLDRKNGLTYKELDKKYSVAKSTLSYIFNNAEYVK